MTRHTGSHRTKARPQGVRRRSASAFHPYTRSSHAHVRSPQHLRPRGPRTHPAIATPHRPDDEKRMIVLLLEDDFEKWLDAPPERSMEFMRACAPQELVAIGEPRY